jgi:hypothetical protein
MTVGPISVEPPLSHYLQGLRKFIRMFRRPRRYRK